MVHDRRQIGVNQAQVYTVPPSVVHQVACLPWTPDGPRICRSGGTTPARGSKGSILEFWVVGANRLQFRVNNPPTSTAQPLGSSNGRGWRSLAAWAGPALCHLPCLPVAAEGRAAWSGEGTLVPRRDALCDGLMSSRRTLSTFRGKPERPYQRYGQPFTAHAPTCMPVAMQPLPALSARQRSWADVCPRSLPVFRRRPYVRNGLKINRRRRAGHARRCLPGN